MRYFCILLFLLHTIWADSFILQIQQSFHKAFEIAHNKDNNLPNHKKPKLVIIMDDIQNLEQYMALRKLGLAITPSLFPKTPYSPKTPQIAKNTAEYMVHLPLEALNFYQKELEPLNTGISRETLLEYMKALKNDFPNLKYLNNHTGSKFTASYEDMKNLLSVFDELDLRFIDSVTSSDIVSPKIALEQGKLIMQRDIFLDNIPQEENTLRQINLAIQKAKDKGYAIAICHPLPSTLTSLQKAKTKLLQEVEILTPAELESFLHSQNITYYNRSKFHYAQNY